MRVLNPVLFAGAALGGLCVSALSAQPTFPDSGGWHLHLGIGPGWSAFPVPKDLREGSISIAQERVFGLSGSLGLSSGIKGKWRLGVELNAWTGVDDGIKRKTQFGLLGVAYGYPFSKRGFFLKGGLGGGFVVVDSLDGGKEGQGEGLAYLIGAGWDLMVWRGTVLAPYFEVPFMRRFRGGAPNTIQVGLGFRR